MDRLETKECYCSYETLLVFTFQYGQIRNHECKEKARACSQDLHSSMDRLETRNTEESTRLNKIIYIPVWIDQKLEVS